MTSEQVAELRKMLRTREKYGTDPWPRMWDLVPRLLDEREALLKVLKALAADEEGSGRCYDHAAAACRSWCGMCQGEVERDKAAKVAIAKAESP